MLTNETLIRKVHENFREIIQLTYVQALDRIDLIHRTLIMTKAEGSNGKGQLTKGIVINIDGVNKDQENQKDKVLQCGKCKSSNHITTKCKLISGK